MKKIVVLVFLQCLLVFPILTAKAFHLLIVGDIEDSSLKESVKRNIHNIKHSFLYLSSITHIPIHIKELQNVKKNITREHIQNWIQHEKVAPDDVIIFYYSGHGHRSYSPLIWPDATFPDFEKKADISFSEIIENLFSKNAFFYLVFLDCCNFWEDPKGVPHIQVDKEKYIIYELKKNNEEQVATNCRELFFKRPGFIIASGSSPEEGCWNDVPTHPEKARGGIFSKVFLNYLFQEFHKSHPSWEHIFRKTKEECILETKKRRYRPSIYSDDEHQTPQYRINLHKKRKDPRQYREDFLSLSKP